MLVIIHGWSDSSRSFEKLGREIVGRGIATGVHHVRLGDYVSLDDDVTFDDVAAALEKAWKKEGLPEGARSVDVIVHSTGALVVRHWMTTFRTASTCPIHRLLMLAPANFGSPLAHKGRSFFGRIVKGFGSERRFHTGTHILSGLEMASPFSWELAMRDRFSSTAWYGRERILCTVLVGNTGYSGISAAANESGSDGTVLVSTANLNPVHITLDFCNDPQAPVMKMSQSRGITAFARLNPENHSSIAMKDKGFRSDQAWNLIAKSLTVSDAGFDQHVADCAALSEAQRNAVADDGFRQGYQNTVVRLTDSEDAYVDDYFIEFFAKKLDTGRNVADERMTTVIQEKMIGKVHVYDGNAAYRSVKFNTTALFREFEKDRVARAQKAGANAEARNMYISISALPDIRKTQSVGYSTFGWDDIGSITVTPARQKQFFVPDRTALVDIRILREQTDKVFQFRRLPA